MSYEKAVAFCWWAAAHMRTVAFGHPDFKVSIGFKTRVMPHQVTYKMSSKELTEKAVEIDTREKLSVQEDPCSKT